MSDVMFNEVGIKPNTKYSFGDWRQIAVHDDKNVKGFFGPYRWLSNFHVCAIEYEGLIYPSTENAYQAAKVVPSDRHMLANCTPADSKKAWKMCKPLDKTAEEWDARKLKVMTWVTLEKYNKHPELRQKLLDTGERYLEESLWWRDKFWGVDVNLGGENNLGKLLMKVRTYWEIKASRELAVSLRRTVQAYIADQNVEV